MSAINNFILLIATVSAIALFHFFATESADLANTTKHASVNINERQNIALFTKLMMMYVKPVQGHVFFNGLMDSYSSMVIPHDQVHISVIMHGLTVY